MIHNFLLKRFLRSVTLSDNPILRGRHEFWRQMCKFHRKLFPSA